MDFDHEFIPTEKYDAKYSHKKERGYFSGIATIGEMLVAIENRDANTNVRFHQKETLANIFERLARRAFLLTDVAWTVVPSLRKPSVWYTDTAANFIYGIHAAKPYMNECLKLKIGMQLKSTLKSINLIYQRY